MNVHAFTTKKISKAATFATSKLHERSRFSKTFKLSNSSFLNPNNVQRGCVTENNKTNTLHRSARLRRNDCTHTTHLPVLGASTNPAHHHKEHPHLMRNGASQKAYIHHVIHNPYHTTSKIIPVLTTVLHCHPNPPLSPR